MIRIAFVRGAYLNNYEGQNYALKEKDMKLVGFSSLHPLENEFPFPVVRLPSIPDFLSAKSVAVKAIANRTFGDMQILFGLGSYASKFDIFHTADPHYYYSYQLARLKEKGSIKKLLVTSWETIPRNNESVKRKRDIKRFVMRHADRFLCYTQRAKDCLVEEGIEENRIEVIRLGVDTARFKPSVKKKDGSPLTLLFAGRLVEEKGVTDAYEAFKLNIAKTGTRMVLRIVGDGPLKKTLQRNIRRDGLENSIAIESKPYREMHMVYRDADIFMLPSKRTRTWEEQYGMVLLEAMASGLPVAAYDTGAIREVAGSSSILVKQDDIRGLADAIGLLKDNSIRRKLGTIGRERAIGMFDSAAASKKIAGLYRSMYKI